MIIINIIIIENDQLSIKNENYKYKKVYDLIYYCITLYARIIVKIINYNKII